MSTLTMMIAWLLSLVGLQDCESPTVSQITCPTATATATAPMATTEDPTTNGGSQPVGFISNGL